MGDSQPQSSSHLPANPILPSQKVQHGGPLDPGASTPPSATAPRPIRRRMRMITSCLECRRRKLKCDKSQPCGHCLKNTRECLYMGPKLDEASQLRLTRFKNTVGSLEKQLERNVVSPPGHGVAGAADDGLERGTGKVRHGGVLVADEVADEDDEGAGLEPLDVVNIDLVYEYDADGGADDLVDLGVMVGRMRITERIGGIARPRLAEEVQVGIAGQPAQSPLGQMPQPPSQTPKRPPGPTGPPQPTAGTAPFEFWPGMPVESWPDFLRPSPSYIPPSSTFMMGQASSTSTAILSLEHLLPTKDAADRLVQQYFHAVHPVARCVHGPSFQAEYADFWTHVWKNVEPRPSLQALVFAALFSAAVSMDEATAMREFGRSHRSLHEGLKVGVELALSKANFLRTTRVQTLQAFVMYMIPLCRDEVSRAHSVLIGTAIRMAECMGLHRDGQTYGLNPLDTHVRRLMWHQLCFLDIRTCEAQGPRPSIRRDEYDTKLPLNCNDEDFLPTSSGGPPPNPQPQNQWTSMLLPLIRFEINEMMRIIWIERRKLEVKSITLTSLLTKIETFRKSMLSKYDHLLDDAVPIQRYSRLVLNLLLYRLHAMVLPMFHGPSSPGATLPPRLNRLLITAGVMILEIGIQLEKDPLFSLWAWYKGAYHQFQIALLLATELYVKPDTLDAGRIWACLDYVFNTDHSLPPERKTLQILGELVSKVGTYHRMRKAIAPATSSRVVFQPVKPPPEQTQYQPSQQQYIPQEQQQKYRGLSDPYQLPLSAPPPPVVSFPQAPPAPPGPNAVYAGISDGQTLWSAPMMLSAGYSSEDSSSPSDHDMATGAPPNRSLEVDWDVLNGLFMTDPRTGDFSISGFGDGSLGMHWQY